MRFFGTPVLDYMPAATAAAVAAVYLATAFGYSPEARAAPLLIGWTVVALALLDIASRTQTPLGATLTRWLNPTASLRRPQHARVDAPVLRQVSAVGWIAGFVFAFATIGALYAIPVYIFAATRWRGGRPYWVCALSAAGTLLLIWLLFSRMLRLELYPGLLFGGLL